VNISLALDYIDNLNTLGTTVFFKPLEISALGRILSS
jgi:hypothetical protein